MDLPHRLRLVSVPKMVHDGALQLAEAVSLAMSPSPLRSRLLAVTTERRTRIRSLNSQQCPRSSALRTFAPLLWPSHHATPGLIGTGRGCRHESVQPDATCPDPLTAPFDTEIGLTYTEVTPTASERN